MKRPDLSRFELKSIPARPALGINFRPHSLAVEPGGWVHGLAVGKNDGIIGVECADPGRADQLEEGDVVLAFAGTRVESTACLGIVLSRCEPHHDYELIVLRLKRENNIPVSGRVFKTTIGTRGMYGAEPPAGYGM